MPKISVVMAVYNCDKYLGEAVDSIRTQTFRDFEFIIVDDGSSDRSGELLRQYSKNDARINLIQRENRGLVYSLNQACHLAQGEYVARMDADDVALPKRFEKQLEFMTAAPEVSAVGSKVELIDSVGAPLKYMAGFTSHKEIDQCHMRGEGGAIIHPAALIRYGALENVGFYSSDYEYAEDLDLWLRVAEIGQLANLSEVLLQYRQHANSIGSSKREQQYLSARRAVESAHRRRKLIFDEAKFMTYKETPSLVDMYLKWGWWALEAKNVSTARKYAILRGVKKPISIDSLKLLAASIRGW